MEVHDEARDQSRRGHDAARYLRQGAVTRREPLPEPKMASLRRLVRMVCALEARAEGQFIVPLGEGGPPPRTVGLTLERMTVGERLACLDGATNLVLQACWGAGEEVVLLATDGHQIAGAELDPDGIGA